MALVGLYSLIGVTCLVVGTLTVYVGLMLPLVAVYLGLTFLLRGLSRNEAALVEDDEDTVWLTWLGEPEPAARAIRSHRMPRPTINGFERDLISKWRKKFGWNPGIAAYIKRGMNRRYRQQAKTDIREGRE